MKKLLSGILALVLMLSLIVPAFAATNDGSQGTNIDVKAKYNGGAATTDTIHVNIEWGEMAFTYNVNGTKTWNAATHAYVDNTTKNWTATGNTITITSHSNVPIKATLSFAAAAAYNTVTGTFDKTVLTLPSAVGKELNDQSLVGTSNLILGGTLADTVTEMTQIGTITVAIAKNNG